MLEIGGPKFKLKADKMNNLNRRLFLKAAGLLAGTSVIAKTSQKFLIPESPNKTAFGGWNVRPLEQRQPVIYKGWKSILISNEWQSVYILPELGGRIIQVDFGGYEFLFVNSSLVGKEPDSTRLGENGTWLNYGGEKIWPAPQGWDSPEQWPGPPDPVLDGGIYTVKGLPAKKDNEVILMSPEDARTGLQIEKRVFVLENISAVNIHATFWNKSNITRKWSIWPVLQMNVSVKNFENRYQIVCPANPESKFDSGYRILYGLVNNPQYVINRHGNMVINYQYLVGKVGLDTHSNWVAFHDRKYGKVFALMFQNEKNKLYPNDTCVQIWTQGRGLIYSRNKITEFKNDKKLNPPYMEMELLSPLQEIQPGKNIQFEYRILTCTLPEEEEIRSVNNTGVIGASLNIVREHGEISIQGRYGVFVNGVLRLMLKADPENRVEESYNLYETKVSPFKGIDINYSINKDKKGLLDQYLHISVDIFDENNHLIGEIDKIETGKQI